MTLLQLLKACCLLALSAAALLVALLVVSSSARPVRELGLRGLRRRRALVEGSWRWLEPMVRWLGGGLAPILSERLRGSLNAQLVRAGEPLGLEPEEIVALTLLGGLCGASGGALYAWSAQGSPLYVLFLSVGLALMPFVRIDSIARERSLRIQRGLPNVVDLLCLGLSAGLDFPSAIRQVVEKNAQKDDPLVEELSLVLNELQLGKTRREALELMQARNPLDCVREFVSFIVQSEEEGNPLGQVLSVQATVSRQARGVRAEELASKAGIKIMMPVGLAMVSVLILIAAPLMLNALSQMKNGF